MVRHLVLTLEGPMIAFGGEAVDARGVIADFPSASMLTGMIGNALEYRRGERARLARLQDRLIFAARIDRADGRITDFQTAQLGAGDRGWTTRGRIEGRAGGAGTYNSPHIRRRDYDCDMAVTVVLRLAPADEAPTLDDVVGALLEPARPLFLGRKPCLPACPIMAPEVERRFVDASDLAAALDKIPSREGNGGRILLPAEEPEEKGDELRWITDARDWRSGVHGGSRRVRLRNAAARGAS